MKILTSLAEKDYFLGLSALINSVAKNGNYVDKVVIGYRFDLPEWLPKLQTSVNGTFCTLPSGLILEFVRVDGNLHMVHEKPKWFKYLMEVLEPNADEYFFFDSDIVIINRMSFFGEWVKEGVALCEDVNYDMSDNHPIRSQWKKIAETHNLSVKNNLNRYYNSGFLGWTRENAKFIEEWHTSFQVLSKFSGDMKKFRVQDRTYAVLSANQDSLNLAAMITSENLSTIGPQAMGFHYGMPIMSHPIGPKPWKRNFILDFLNGFPPRPSDIHFWKNLNGTELKPYSNFKIKLNIILCKTLRGLSRIYSS